MTSEELGITFKRAQKYREAIEQFDQILVVCTDSQKHYDWRTEAEIAYKCKGLTHLSKFQILKRLEDLRKDRIRRSAAQVKADCIAKDRCPKCTLKLPCKHFESVQEIYKKGRVF